MDAKHTPGPWSVNGPNNPAVASVGIHDDEDWVIADMCDDFELELVMANARLIAAAPMLLAGSMIALEVAESWIHDQLDGTSSLEVALAGLDPVRAAIAAATGAA